MVASLTGHTNRVLYLAMSPDGETIVTGAGDETLRFWNAFPKKEKNERGKESRLDYGRLIRWGLSCWKRRLYSTPRLPPSSQLRQQKAPKTKAPPRTCMRIRSMLYMRLLFFPLHTSSMFVFICAKKVTLDPPPQSVNLQRVLYCYPYYPPANATMSVCYARQTSFLYFLFCPCLFFNVCE